MGPKMDPFLGQKWAKKGPKKGSKRGILGHPGPGPVQTGPGQTGVNGVFGPNRPKGVKKGSKMAQNGPKKGYFWLFWGILGPVLAIFQGPEMGPQSFPPKMTHFWAILGHFGHFGREAPFRGPRDPGPLGQKGHPGTGPGQDWPKPVQKGSILMPETVVSWTGPEPVLTDMARAGPDRSGWAQEDPKIAQKPLLDPS